MTKNTLLQKTNLRKSNRRGAALIIALVLLLLVSAISASLIRGFYADRRERDRVLIRIQAEMLHDDFARRAEIRRAAVPDFTGETLLLSDVAMFDGTFHLTSSFPEGTVKPDIVVEYYDQTDKLIFAGRAEKAHKN